MFGHPIFDFFVVEEDGHLAATTLVTYAARCGHLSVVSVARPYRRRGYAQAVLTRAHAEIRHLGRRYAVLEVLTENAPAIALYHKLGYRRIAEGVVVQRDPTDADLARPPPPVPGLRRFHRRDAAGLLPLADTLAGPALAEVSPATPDRFVMLPLIAASTRSESAAWVLEERGRLVGFLRATVGGITRTAHLTQPLIDPSVPLDAAAGMLEAALHWVRAQERIRIVAEVPDSSGRAAALLTAAGFRPAYRLATFALDLGP